MASQFIELPVTSGSGGVTSLNGQTGDLTLLAGSNITITPGAGTLTIAASGTGLGDINNGGNSFGSDITIGTNDNFSLHFETNGVTGGTVDTISQWSFGANATPNRTHGFYKDTTAGQSTNSVILNVGNSGAAQGVGYLSFNNQIVTNSPSFDLGFSPRNNADAGATLMGLIRIQKGGTDDSGTMYFSTSDAGGTLNLAMTVTPAGDLELTGQHRLQFDDAVGGQYVAFQAPATVNGSVTYTWPDAPPPASPQFLQSDNAGVMSWVNNPATGVANMFAGFDGSGDLYSIPNWVIDTGTGGASVHLTQTVAADNYAASIENFVLEINPSVVTTNVNLTGFNLELSVDRTGSNNNYGGNVNGLFNTLSLEGNATVNAALLYNAIFRMGTGTNTGTLSNASAIEINSFVDTGYTVSSFNGIRSELNGTGTVTNATMLSNIVSASVTNNLDIIYSSCGGNTIGGNLRVAHFDINGNVTGDAEGFNVGFGGTTGGNLNGLNFNSTAAVTGNLNGFTISASGAVGGDIKGISVNLGSATSPNQKTGLQINDAALSVSSPYDTGVLNPDPGFGNLNILGGSFHIASGFPVVNSAYFGNNLGITAIFEDDMGADTLGGLIGFSMNGFASAFTVAVGKTVNNMNFMVAGAQVPTGVIPTDGGTITNMSMFRAIGVLNGGGSVVIDKIYGFKADAFLSTYATTSWGVHISDPNANNWFLKNVVIGGATGLPTGSYALDVIGDIVFDGTIHGTDNNESINSNDRHLISSSGNNVVLWDSQLLVDNLGSDSLNWGQRHLQDSSGNTVLEWAGPNVVNFTKQISVTSAGGSIGQSTLVAGTVTVTTAAISAASNVFVTVQTAGGVQGFLSITNVVNGVSFDILSTSVLETSVVGWLIVDQA